MRVLLVILLILVLLCVVVCLSDIVVAVKLKEGKFTWGVSYFGIHVLPLKKKAEKALPDAETPEKKQKKPKKPKAAGVSKKAKKQQKKEEERKAFLTDKLWKLVQKIAGFADLGGSALSALPGPFQKLLRAVKWCDIETDFVIGGEDAAACAKLYGTVQALLPMTWQAQHIIRVQRRSISVKCDFTEDKCRWDLSCKVKVRIGTVLAAGIWLGVRFLLDSRKYGKLVEKKM